MLDEAEYRAQDIQAQQEKGRSGNSLHVYAGGNPINDVLGDFGKLIRADNGQHNTGAGKNNGCDERKNDAL